MAKTMAYNFKIITEVLQIVHNSQRRFIFKAMTVSSFRSNKFVESEMLRVRQLTT